MLTTASETLQFAHRERRLQKSDPIPMHRPRVIYTVILSGTAIWCGAVLLAPICALSSEPLNTVASILYQFFRPICHQLESRSFHLFGEPLAVCSRCASIYFAFLLGTVLYPIIRTIKRSPIPPPALLLVSALPMILDVLAAAVGINEPTPLSRTLTGALFGIVVPFYIVPAAIEAFCPGQQSSEILHT